MEIKDFIMVILPALTGLLGWYSNHLVGAKKAVVEEKNADITNLQARFILMEKAWKLQQEAMERIMEQHKISSEEMLKEERAECDEKILALMERVEGLEKQRELRHELPFAYLVKVNGYYEEINETAWIKIFSRMGYINEGVLGKADWQVWGEKAADIIADIDKEAMHSNQGYAMRKGVRLSLTFPFTFLIQSFVISIPNNKARIGIAHIITEEH